MIAKRISLLAVLFSAAAPLSPLPAQGAAAPAQLQLATVYRNSGVSTISSGRTGYETPTGGWS